MLPYINLELRRPRGGDVSPDASSLAQEEAAVLNVYEQQSSSSSGPSLRRCKTSVDLDLSARGWSQDDGAAAARGDDARAEHRLTASALERHEERCALEALGLGGRAREDQLEAFYRALSPADPPRARQRERVSCALWFRRHCRSGSCDVADARPGP